MDAGDAALPLTAVEARLLGCLIEKQATTPDQYPLTVNAAQAAANQKTAREPVLSIEAGAAHHALRQLEGKGLAKQVFSSRAERYEHRADAFFGLPRAQVVLLGLLLLRGAQTQHELLARSERMHAFADVEDLRHHLDRLIRHAPALVALLPRASGQREDRYVHLMSGEVVVGEVQTADIPAMPPTQRDVLESRIEALETDVAALRARLEALLAASPD